MTLKTTTLYGERDLVELSIERIIEYCPPEGYYGTYSGEKDSGTIKRLTEMAMERAPDKVKVDWHYNYVGIDPPELVKFIKEHHPDVEFHMPSKSFFKYMFERGFPPMRMIRWCCRLLKEEGGNRKDKGRVVMTGVRWAESSRRAQRRMFEGCRRDPSKHYLHPIIDWSDEDVWEFHRQYNVPYCHLYDEGYKRLGCLFCPMAREKRRRMDAARYPKFVHAFKVAFARLFEQLKAKGKRQHAYSNVDEMWEWWLTDQPRSKDHKEQQHFCFDD